ncbi:MAG TPA: flippase activity-associated protein Agl23 [Ktedonobacteraceae bacterium]|nr:flippase activity-associated protein Agl23 [Ktedonobacteraceae bacterium]
MKSYETTPLHGEDGVLLPARDESGTEIEEQRVDESSLDEDVQEQRGSVVVADYPAEADEGQDEIGRKRFHFRPPSREQLIRWLPFWGTILLGAILRFWGLGDKPLHHDESLHAYYSLQLMQNIEHWWWCISPPPQDPTYACYTYNPLLHGPFQFHAIALVYKVSQLLGAPDNGVNTTTVRIAAATLGTVIVGLPYFLRDYLGKWGAWLASFLLAVSPSMVYFSRFAREDIYFACFTLLWIVAAGRYMRDRKMRWLVISAAGFALAYATKEAIFLEILVFGGFLGALIVWEIGLRLPLRARLTNASAFVPKTFAPVLLLIYFVIAGISGKLLLSFISQLSRIILPDPNGQPTVQADQFVTTLKTITVEIVPWVGIALGIYVLSILYREMKGNLPAPGRRGLAKQIDPERQPVLDAILTMPWTHWFFALLCGWAIFLVLFTVLFTNVANGIGDGIWQGIYYWIQQQQVARGNQPWYYYLMLIPLYEQIGIVFGIVGVIRCLVRPTRFRLFMAYWFVGNFFIYSWAAEKMPWLMIHITMPMMILAAIGLEPLVVTAVNFAKGLFAKREKVEAGEIATTDCKAAPVAAYKTRRVGVLSGSAAILGVLAALLLLIPTLHNMYEVVYVHPADGPHEMMVYVQTTTDVNIVMAKVDALDQKFYGGHHQMPIALTSDATWPFAWYVRDYPNVCFDYPTGCPNWPQNLPVIIAGGDNPYQAELTYGGQNNNGPYAYHQYHMRSWWDEGYKPSDLGGVGPLLWLSYGDFPPPNAKFNPGLAAQHIWNWWWNRSAIGDTHGAYDMVLFIRKDLSATVQP